MKDFAYCAPSTLREAVALKAEKGEAARVLAGGTDLIVQLRGKRFYARLHHRHQECPRGQRAFLRPPPGVWSSARACPAGASTMTPKSSRDTLGSSIRPAIIGGIQIQGRATFGGNLCNASPSADTIPSLITHSAVCHIAGPDGKRQVAVEDFCTAPGRSVLALGEILVSLQIPIVKKNTSSHYQRFIPRNEMDIAVVGVSSHVVLANRGKEFKAVRIALAAGRPHADFRPRGRRPSSGPSRLRRGHSSSSGGYPERGPPDFRYARPGRVPHPPRRGAGQAHPRGCCRPGSRPVRRQRRAGSGRLEVRSYTDHLVGEKSSAPTIRSARKALH